MKKIIIILAKQPIAEMVKSYFEMKREVVDLENLRIGEQLKRIKDFVLIKIRMVI